MDLLTIEINKQKYIYLDSINLDGKEYVVYMDDDNIFVSECFQNEELYFDNVSDEIYQKVIEVFDL